MAYTKNDIRKARAALVQAGELKPSMGKQKILAELLYREREGMVGQLKYLLDNHLFPALRGDPEGLIATLKRELKNLEKPRLVVKVVSNGRDEQQEEE